MEVGGSYFINIQHFIQPCFTPLQSAGVTGKAIDPVVWNPVIKTWIVCESDE